jgi:hypothetical protein
VQRDGNQFEEDQAKKLRADLPARPYFIFADERRESHLFLDKCAPHFNLAQTHGEQDQAKKELP